jgi:hypothetical protein
MKKDFDWSPDEEALEHFGVKGMRWGVSRQAFRDRQSNRIARGEKLNEKKAPKTRSLVRNTAAGTAGVVAGLTAITAGLNASTATILTVGGVTAGAIVTTPAWAPVAIIGGTAAYAIANGASTYKYVSEVRASYSANKARADSTKKKK